LTQLVGQGEPSSPASGGRRRGPIALAALVAGGIGVFIALNQLFGGYYDLTTWAPIGLVALVALVALTIAYRHPVPHGTGWATGGLLALSAIQFLSSRWAESVDRALVDSHRTLLLAAGFVLLCVVAQRRDSRFALIGAIAVVTTVLNVILAVRLLQPALPDGMFVTGRLYGPLGYTNGQAAVMLLGVWPLLAAAERVRSRALAGVALGSAALSLNLFLLTQSRGGVAAVALSALVMLAFVPGRVWRLALLVPLAAGVAFVLPRASDAYESSVEGVPAAADVHDVVIAALAVAVAVGLLGALIRSIRPLERLEGVRLAPAGIGLVIVVAIGAALVAGAPGAIDRGWSNFKSLEPPPVESRLASGGGNRYDYWRIAVDEWSDRPIAGLGAGNYYRDYFLERQTTEDIRQPHSLPLQVLAETGLLGGLALLVFVVAVLAAAVRATRRRDVGAADRALAVGASGAFVLWLLHTSVDWLHLLPGITLAALASAAVLLALGARPRTRPPRLRSPVRPLLFAGAVIAVASLGVLFLAERYRLDARDSLAADPAAALERGRNAFELNNQSVPTLYTIAAAHARLNNYEEAVTTLERAEALEPHNWVSAALLGDLASRRRDFRLAAVSYGRAADLNPRNTELRELETEALDADRVARQR
jgi:O-antigen ligase